MAHKDNQINAQISHLILTIPLIVIQNQLTFIKYESLWPCAGRKYVLESQNHVSLYWQTVDFRKAF